MEKVDKLNFYILVKQVQPFLTSRFTELTRLLAG